MRTPRHRIQFRINGRWTTDNKRNVVRCFLRRDAPPARIQQQIPINSFTIF